jgi:hypothetical protein
MVLILIKSKLGTDLKKELGNTKTYKTTKLFTAVIYGFS